jgi:peroxidase
VDFDMPVGRLDGRVSISSHALNFLLPPTFSLSQLVHSFNVKGLNEEDMVVLSGAPTAPPSSPTDSPCHPTWTRSSPRASLRRQCPANPTVVTPAKLDSQYYKNILTKKVLFTSDDALLTSPATGKMVRDNAFVPGLREEKYKAAMVKMASIKVKTTGNAGEIRKNCRVVN